MDKVRAVRAAIAENAKRLEEIGQGDEMSKRVKKRILQKLGKLKKDLSDLEKVHGVAGDTGSTIGEKRKAAEEVEAGDEDAPVAVVLSKEERKLKLRLLNKDLAEFAQKKQLSFAKKRFEWGIRKGIKVDVHSYTNLINAYVRCSDLSGAEDTLRRMIQSGVTPNLVTYTTLMKGYSEVGDVDHASRIYFDYMNRKLAGAAGQRKEDASMRPNVRSLNTFLRACVRTGQHKPALQSFSDFVASSGKTAGTDEEYRCDGSTYEYIMGLLCRSGLKAVAETILARFTEMEAQSHGGAVSAGGVSVIENTAIYLSLATSCALSGDFQAARKWADLTADALKRTESATLKDSMLKRFQASADMSDKKVGGASKDDKGERSVALFLQHRRIELEGQLQVLDDYLGIANTATSVGEDPIASQRGAVEEYLRCLSQVQFFGFDGQCDYDSFLLSGDALQGLEIILPKSTHAAHGDNSAAERARVAEERSIEVIAARLLIALRDKFGLDSVTLPALSTIGVRSADVKQAHESYDSARKGISKLRKQVAEKVFSSVNSSTGKIDFTALFAQVVTDTPKPTAGKSDTTTTSSTAVDLSTLPVKLEICSGDGEWVVAQAEADWTAPAPTATSATVKTPKALWAALELRCDRIQHTLAHYILSNPYASFPTKGTIASPLRNLALIGGNAAKIIPERIAACSIAEIFINHPQPPDRVTGGGDVAVPNNSSGSKEQDCKKSKKDLGKDKNQGAHLLTQEFFAELVRILKVGGTITLVTDNQAYAKSLAASIAVLPAVLCGVNGQGQQSRAVLAGAVDRYDQPAHWDYSLDDSHPITLLQQGGGTGSSSTSSRGPVLSAGASGGACGRSVDVWRGEPGPEAGHVVQASSYFDRMWDLGQKKRRWFLFVRKVEF